MRPRLLVMLFVAVVLVGRTLGPSPLGRPTYGTEWNAFADSADHGPTP